MSQEPQTIGKQITFAQLFEEFGRVQIPIIQRDYAQGRPDQEDLRSDFLGALKEALSSDSHSTIPLDLDFVYGSGFNEKEDAGQAESFAPLDGQQRLTTLFLLHWYLAWTDGQSEDFRKRFLKDEKSLFAYEVRPSSHDFFNRFAQYQPDSGPTQTYSISKWIQDAAWFFLSWKYDPTILSALTILDSIHKEFSGCNGYYERLVDNEHPRITFQLLELRNFGLSDDLYIKMNARGKPLTPFENFKARLEQHLDEFLGGVFYDLPARRVKASEYFSHQMDTKWADLFWNHRDRKSNLFDDRVMRLIHNLAVVSTGVEDKDSDQIVSRIRDMKYDASFARYHEFGCLNESMLRTLIALLNYWSDQDFEEQNSNSTSVYNITTAFKASTSTSLSYPDLVRFAAFAKYVCKYGPGNGESLEVWMRVIHNLVENGDIERSSQLASALIEIERLIENANSILEHLSKDEPVKFFYSWQIREERIKATLMLKGGKWYDEIIRAERHPYFNGQIEFLLDFSGILDWWLKNGFSDWTADTESDHLKRFTTYLTKSELVFGPTGLKRFRGSVFERALLSEGDYTLRYRKNRSFLQNPATSGSGNRPAWKTLLRGRIGPQSISGKRSLIKSVLDKVDIDTGVVNSLRDKITSASVQEAWRRMLIDLPPAIDYCGQRMFRIIDGGAVYLISKQRTSSEHIELWSYFIYKTVLKKLDDSGALMPFKSGYFKATNEDYQPAGRLYWSAHEVTINIDFVDNKYCFSLLKKDTEVRERIRCLLKDLFESETQDEWDVYFVPPEIAENAIRKLVDFGQELELSNIDNET